MKIYFYIILALWLLSCGDNDSDEELEEGTSAVIITADEIDTGLPVVIIQTEGGKSIASKDEYVNASMTIKYKGETLHSNAMKIRGRGNATWFNSWQTTRQNYIGFRLALGIEP